MSMPGKLKSMQGLLGAEIGAEIKHVTLCAGVI